MVKLRALSVSLTLLQLYYFECCVYDTDKRKSGANRKVSSLETVRLTVTPYKSVRCYDDPLCVDLRERPVNVIVNSCLLIVLRPNCNKNIIFLN